VDSHLNGIMKTTLVTSQCQDISNVPCNDLLILRRRDRNTRHTRGKNHSTEQKHNMPLVKMSPHFLIQLEPSMCRRCLVSYYFTPEQLTTMLPAIGTIATQKAQGMRATMNAITQLLNYCVTNPNAVVQYYASDMVFHIDSDTSYLTAPKAHSRAAGYHYLGLRPKHNGRQ